MEEQNIFFPKESKFEEEITEKLVALGWEEISSIQREDAREIIDFNLLHEQIKMINDISDEMANQATSRVKRINDTLANMNKEAWDLLVEGIKVYDKQSKLTKTVKLFDENSANNIYQVIRQLKVSNGSELRYPDIVLYINGLPVVIFELKAPLASENIEDAFKQNESLKCFCPNLWTFNVMNFLSNRIISLYGSTLATFKRMHKVTNLKIKEGADLIQYLFNKEQFYKFITTFSFYSIEHNMFIKYMAAPHQIEAVKKTMAKLKNAKDNRGGVVWHTQGSGKSVTMLMLTKSIIAEINNATIVVVTDRNTLDQQLFERFLNAYDYLRNKAVAIKSRQDLIKKLENKKHFGVYFSTVQKFTEETGALTNRDDVFLLVDEAHRSQNNIDGERNISKEREEFILKFGYARYMRDAFPNAKIVGFTGTPLMKSDKETTQIFGDYNHTYSMNDSVGDSATVPIHYEMRKVKINLNEEYLKEMDLVQKEYVNSLDPNDIVSQQKIDSLLKSVKITEVLEDDEVIEAKARDMLNHLAKRKVVLHGKAMIVASTRKAAFKYYQTIKRLASELDNKVILVITHNNKDDEAMKNAIVPHRDIHKVANEFRKDNSKYQIAIVVDMWLTGFDVPDLDVLYIDKFIKWHNLMQAIARINRTYEDKQTKQVKENGLIVDYIGIWKFLAAALLQYASGVDKGIDFSIEDVSKAKEKLNERLEIINESYIKGLYNFDILNAKEQYNFIILAQDYILSLDIKEKNKFILLARDTKRFFKMAYSVITQKEATLAKCVEIVNSLISTTSIQTDEKLQNTIELIKEAIAKAVDSKVSDVYVSESKISKNVNEVATILATEAKELEKSAPRVAIEMLKHSIQVQLKNLENIRPIFYKNASDKLREIIINLEKMEDVQKVIELLRQLGKEVTNEANRPLEFTDDPQLQAFYDVISNDAYLKSHENSEVLRRIAEELLDKIKECGTEQFENNPQVKSKIKIQLQILLKTKYNYPPDYLKEVSGILVDQITNQIRINKDFFRKDD